MWKRDEKTNDGGPAFPAGVSAGMSLRDWFAGQALTGWISDSTANVSEPDNIAEHCYELADAMVAEKEKRDEGN